MRSKPKAVVFCLEPHDLILSKLAANRECDWDFARDAIAAGLVSLPILIDRAETPPIRDELRRLITASLRANAVRSQPDR